MYRHPNTTKKEHTLVLERDINIKKLELEVFKEKPCFITYLRLTQQKKFERIEELCQYTEYCSFADLLIEYALTGRKPKSSVLLEELQALHPPQKANLAINPFSQPYFQQLVHNIETSTDQFVQERIRTQTYTYNIQLL